MPLPVREAGVLPPSWMDMSAKSSRIALRLKGRREEFGAATNAWLVSIVMTLQLI